MGVVVALSLFWLVTIEIAWNTGHWVGASNPIPIKAQVVALLPSIVGAVAGIVCMAIGALRKSRNFVAAGITALLVAGLLVMVTNWFLFWGSIT